MKYSYNFIVVILHTSLMMIFIFQAERAADLIQGNPVLPPANVPVYEPKSLETRRWIKTSICTQITKIDINLLETDVYGCEEQT